MPGDAVHDLLDGLAQGRVHMDDAGDILQHRLRLLAGNRWEMRNVSHG